MSIPLWPTDLPQRLELQQFNTTVRDGRLQTPMEIGPPKLRRRTALAARPVTGSFITDYDGYGRLLRFWDEEILGGSLPFIIPDQILDDQPIADETDVPITDANSVPLLIAASWLVSFSAAPTVAGVSGLWVRVGVSLNILP